jgi:hypothetical protein
MSTFAEVPDTPEDAERRSASIDEEPALEVGTRAEQRGDDRGVLGAGLETRSGITARPAGGRWRGP